MFMPKIESFWMSLLAILVASLTPGLLLLAGYGLRALWKKICNTCSHKKN